MINNRQNGRRRGRGGNGNGNGGGGNPRSGNPGRPDGGNRIDNRARGNANQLYEKYKNLARDAQMGGDRVTTEYYLQFADHYFRVLSESRSRFDDGQPQQQPRRQSSDPFDDFDADEDYADEGEPIRAGEQDVRDRQQQDPRRDDSRQEQRRDGNRTEARRDDTRQDGRRDARDSRDDARQDTRRDGRDDTRQDMRRDETPRDDGRRDEGRRNGHAMNGQADTPVQSAPVVMDAAPERDEAMAVEAPRRTRRPRRDRVESEAGTPAIEAAPIEDNAPAGLDAERLPPSLSLASAPAGDDVEEAPKPRRRRVRAASAEIDAG